MGQGWQAERREVPPPISGHWQRRYREWHKGPPVVALPNRLRLLFISPVDVLKDRGAVPITGELLISSTSAARL